MLYKKVIKFKYLLLVVIASPVCWFLKLQLTENALNSNQIFIRQYFPPKPISVGDSPISVGDFPIKGDIELVHTTGQTPGLLYTKKFLYLTQTEKCIRAHMRTLNALGNSSVCDVLALSFRERCNDTTLPHVSYIFNSSTTLNTGRAELYYAAKQLEMRYLYYIFLDDDVIVEWMHKKRKESPWRSFEQFLVDYEPPLAATDNTAFKIVDKVFAKRKRDRCTMNGTSPAYFLAVWFDATVNAFHYQAIEHILEPVLPYWHRFDGVSWWHSQWYITFIADIVFHEQTMLLSQIMGTNPMHRKYPQLKHDAKILSDIANDVEQVIPFQYRDAASSILKRWVPAYVNILPTTVSETYCHPIPLPRQKVIPYKRLLCTQQ